MLMPSQIRCASDRMQRMHEAKTERRSGDRERECATIARLHFSPHCVVCPWGEIVWCATRYGCASSEQQQKSTTTMKNYRRERKKHAQRNSAYIKITNERKIERYKTNDWKEIAATEKKKRTEMSKVEMIAGCECVKLQVLFARHHFACTKWNLICA